MKSSRIQLLTTKFEGLKMQEDGTIHDYYMNVLDIPKRFDMKVTTIEEAQDISNMQVDELIGSLQNFELVVDNKSEKKGKGIAFAANIVDEGAHGDIVDDENL